MPSIYNISSPATSLRSSIAAKDYLLHSRFKNVSFNLYAYIFDVVCTPKITRLLREVGEYGAMIVTGVEMFIGQAYQQYERFTELPGKHLKNYLARLWENLNSL
ncbi:bifunctional 3-dehydroquinate dehydratase/shikimate dehydrogenase, chloroplastic-like protein, partial [Tanacetum coccineum]